MLIKTLVSLVSLVTSVYHSVYINRLGMV